MALRGHLIAAVVPLRVKPVELGPAHLAPARAARVAAVVLVGVNAGEATPTRVG